MRILALIALFGCQPADVTAERQARSRTGDGEVEEGPAEQAATPDVRAPAQPPASTPAAPGDQPVAPAPGSQDAMAWDQRLLDVIVVHMELTERLATAAATRTQDPAVRAYAEEQRDAAKQWREQAASLRAGWYPDAPPATVDTAPTLAELGPVAHDIAARQGGAGQDPADDRPSQLNGRGLPDEHAAGKPDVAEYGASRRLPEGREVDLGQADAVDRGQPGAMGSRDDDLAFLTGVSERIRRMETEAVDGRSIVEAMEPMHQRAISAANLGMTQAAHPELRVLAGRLARSEQQALENLKKLAGDERG